MDNSEKPQEFTPLTGTSIPITITNPDGIQITGNFDLNHWMYYQSSTEIAFINPTESYRLVMTDFNTPKPNLTKEQRQQLDDQIEDL